MDADWAREGVYMELRKSGTGRKRVLATDGASAAGGGIGPRQRKIKRKRKEKDYEG
jgi:hypothetical protein